MNEQVSIDTMNEVLAEFTDCKYNGNYWYIPFLGLYKKELEFNTSWDWLMAVWFKFIDLRFQDPMQQFKHSEMKTTVGYAILYGDISIAHRNIFEAIEWYNKTKQQ